MLLNCSTSFTKRLNYRPYCNDLQNIWSWDSAIIAILQNDIRPFISCPKDIWSFSSSAWFQWMHYESSSEMECTASQILNLKLNLWFYVTSRNTIVWRGYTDYIAYFGKTYNDEYSPDSLTKTAATNISTTSPWILPSMSRRLSYSSQGHFLSLLYRFCPVHRLQWSRARVQEDLTCLAETSFPFS